MTNKVMTSLFVKNKSLSITFLLLILVIPLIIIKLGVTYHSILLMCIIPVTCIFAFNFQLAIYCLFISFFVNIQVSEFTSSELIGGLLIISFLVTHLFNKTDLENPLVLPLGVFLITMIPSFFNADSAFFTLFISLRVVVFAGLIILIPVSLRDYELIKKLINLFLLFCILNSLHVIYLAISTGGRVFGFAGIMYVDYVSIGIIVSFLSMIYKPQKLMFYLLLTLIFLAGSIFTQTRNTWISCGITILLIIIQFIRKSKELNYNRKKILFITTALLLGILCIIFLTVALHPSSFNRLSSAGVPSNANLNEPDLSRFGSLATRFFIWFTAWNAFLAHPFIGIGLYNFPFVSSNYSTISPILYKAFVKDLSPHITYLAILTETGIVGMMGFLFLLFSILKVSKEVLKKAKFGDYYFYSLILFWIQVYLFFSMTMSDAWLRGHGLMLWGVTLAMFVANYRIVKKANLIT